MKVMVIGSGGREHALSWKISQSQKVDKIYCAPGNGGTSTIAENVNIKANDIEGLLSFAIENSIDLTVVGPEDPLVLGIVDRFEENNLRIFGPNKSAARLEASKEFAKLFMEKYNVATAKYKSFDNYKEGLEALDEYSLPLVIKADGLCLGKGVYICNTYEEAEDALKEILEDNKFGDQGNRIIIEEFLDGVEASLLCFVSGNKIFPMESARDYKKIYDGDLGPNTGGVGCYSPSPLFTQDLKAKIQNQIIDKISQGLKNENLGFNGILFIGLMIVEGQPNVLEFNARFGDPETQVLVPRLDSDIVELFEKTLDSRLEASEIKWKDESCLSVILSSQGYPRQCKTGYEISGCEDIDEDLILFHNGTKHNKDKLQTNGGRVLSLTALGKSIDDAADKVYSNINRIKCQGIQYRRDIGK